MLETTWKSRWLPLHFLLRRRRSMYLENCISRERHQISKARRTYKVCQVKKPFQRKSFKGSRETWKEGNAQRYARCQEKSSKKEHRADALALRADERRDKLRKAMGRSKYPMIHGCLNGATRLRRAQSPYSEYIGIRREPPELKHLSRERKRKKDRFSK